MPEASQEAKDRVAARGTKYRLILQKPVPEEARAAFNEGWREKWGDDAYTPHLSVSGKALYGSFSAQSVQDLLDAGYATDDDYRAVSQVLFDENRIMQDLFDV